MLSHARTAAAARIAAALVVASLSGVPRVLAMHATGEQHRCTCRMSGSGRHQCSCPLCRQAALARASRKEAREDRPGGGVVRSCIEGACGDGSRTLAPTSGVDPFCLPAGTSIALLTLGQTRPAHEQRGPSRAGEPETPPPRQA